MSRYTKARNRLLSLPKDYTYSEVRAFLLQRGFAEYTKGKTSGSRVKFYREEDQCCVLLHKPHPQDVMDIGTLRDLVNRLKELGEL